jgi:hypothetical protein
MRLFAFVCYGITLFYCYTAVETMRTGVATPLRGKTEVEHRRDDAASNYSKYLFARWMIAGGFAVLGVAIQILARHFEKLEAKR